MNTTLILCLAVLIAIEAFGLGVWLGERRAQRVFDFEFRRLMASSGVRIEVPKITGIADLSALKLSMRREQRERREA